MRRRTSFNARSRDEFTRFICVRLMTVVGGCFLLVFCFWRICVSSCTELEGIFCDCALLLLLLYFRLTCFHLESVSVALLFSQERSTPRLRLRAQLRAVWGGGNAALLCPRNNTLLISSRSPSLLRPVRRQQLQLISFIDVFCCIFQAWTTKKCSS